MCVYIPFYSLQLCIASSKVEHSPINSFLYLTIYLLFIIHFKNILIKSAKKRKCIPNYKLMPEEKVLKVLEISETSLGLLTKDNLLIAGKETINGLHLSELFSTIDADNL